jgi:hypothetical protein
LRETRKKWYGKVKAAEETNRKTMANRKEKDISANQRKQQQVKLMEQNGKENIRKYWDERVHKIQESKWKESERRSQMFVESINSISMLEMKEKKLLE